MPFNKKLPEWKAAGIQPPESKRLKGWEVEDRPPADWLNWQMNTTYEALQELHEKAAEKDDVSKALKDAKEYTDKKAQAITPESIGAETPAGAQSKADAAKQDAEQKIADHAGDAQVHVSATDRQEWDGAAAEVSDAPAKKLTFTPGLQVVESEQDAPFRMGEVKGRTLINLLGKVGDCENTADWSAPGPGVKTLSTERVYGSFSIEVGSTKEEQAGFGIRTNGAIKDLTKHYIAIGHVRNVSAQYVHLSFAEVKVENNVTSWFKSNGTVKSNQFTYAYVVVSPEELAGKEKVEVYVRGVASGADQKIAADGIGLYEITEAEYDAIAKMTPEQVAAKYPYVDSMTNVTNPYAIITGGNLLPPFYEADRITVASKATVEAPYELRFGAGGDGDFLAYHLSVLPNKTYTFSLENSGVLWCITELDYNTVVVPYSTDTNRSFNVGDRTQIAFVFKSFSTEIDVSCKNPMLTIGTEPKPFTPQQRSMLAFETELAAHPVDGSNPDTLFMGDDGLPYVLEKWKKLALDGGLEWRFAERFTGFKTVLAYGATVGSVAGSGIVTKYDGKKLGIAADWVTDGPDHINGDIHLGNIYMSIANTDSGWGPDYEPTKPEIAAFFMGYRLLKADGSLYDGEGQRYWNIINPDGSVAPGQYTTTLPTQPHSQWTPYRLQYLKTKPTVEPVRNYEMGSTLSAGSNMVEVGSGIVIREKANPTYYSPNGNYYINNTAVSGSLLKNKAFHILRVYRNNQIDNFAKIENDANAYGKQHIRFLSSDLDPTAVYHVTYTMLDPTLAAPISGTVAANLRGTVSDLVQDVGDVQRRLSVSEVRLNSITSDLNSPLDWITATLLNGWKSVAGRPVQYAMDAFGFVHFRGTLDSSEAAKAVGTDIFKLPIQYRPSRVIGIPTVTYSSPQDIQPYAVDIGNGGSIRITMENTRRFIYLESFSFYVEGGTT
ncbi:hypothetical protein J6TS7_51030 [Paenibacillus dendritiformis]|uniref:hypothetical protein n=1 Tax=Paenibacillus TaxID=44249 RepID=UPI001B02CBBB|nr:hypothetical protein [Paenibacillus dendritiformis]MEB9892698.1 hypothetical protein [Bacillus cereus]GIO81493.1 hypothetical protein J6TS7_51030 [Paenibacillus dendritiformis]